jgi:serine/threonine protein kinase
MVLGGKFALIRPLGQGAVGSVFEALNTWTQRRVAVKVLLPEHAEDAHLVQRFVQEAHAAASIRHPNIVDVLDLDRDSTDGSLFLVLEYVPGLDLRALLGQRGSLAVGESLDLLVPLLGALRMAHQRGIVHRDLKPENIVIGVGDRGETVPKIIDFGVSKILSPMPGGRAATAFGTLLGTPEYMAPEQALGRTDVDHRADVWAMGVILFEMLAGRCPIEGPSTPIVLSQVIEGRVPRIESFCSVDADLASIVHGALTANRDARLPSIDAMLSLVLMYANARVSDGGTIVHRHRSSLDHHAPLFTEDATVVVPGTEGIDLLPSDALELDDDAIPLTNTAERKRAEDALLALEQSVAINDLQGVLAATDELLPRTSIDETQRGRALVLRGTALRWLGRLDDAARAFDEALARLSPSAPSASEALWQRAWCAGELGRPEDLPALVKRFESVASTTLSEARACAAWRLGAALLRSGRGSLAERILGPAQEWLDDPVFELPRVQAVVTGTRAELAMLNGDVSSYIDRTEQAAELYAQSGEAREASVHRVMLADALRQVGAYEEARQRLTDPIEVADRMQLGYVQLWARCVDAACWLRMGDEDPAIASLMAIRATAAEQGHHRLVTMTSIHLVEALRRVRRLDEASAVASESLERAALAPDERVTLLAMKGQLALATDETDEAVRWATRSFEDACALGNAGEGDALARVVYARALVARGQEHLGWGVLAEARRLLVARSRRISREAWGRAFLERVPAHADTLRLGKRWLDVD